MGNYKQNNQGYNNQNNYNQGNQGNQGGYNNQQNQQNQQKPLAVYTVIEQENRDNFWCRIGVAFRNRDGSINVKLNALPVNGTLHIREQSDNDNNQR